MYDELFRTTFIHFSTIFLHENYCRNSALARQQTVRAIFQNLLYQSEDWILGHDLIKSVMVVT